MKNLVHQELKCILNRSVRDTTRRFGGIELMEQDVALSDDVCTVHTKLGSDGKFVLVLCADTALLTRLAQNIMHSDVVTPEDIEETAKEYLNIVCGQFIAGLFPVAQVPDRFQSPSFYPGYYPFGEESICRCSIHYGSGDGGMCLACIEANQLQSA